MLEDRLAPAVAGWSGVAAVAAVPALVSGPSNSTTTAENHAAAVPTAAQYAVSESLGRNDPAYAVAASGGGYTASNAANQYSATVDAGGLRVSTGSDAWSLTVSGVGYGDSLQALGDGTATATANRVEYDYGAVSQWFVNGPLGLQQGFTLDQRPSGGGAGAPLTVGLALGGDLTATADPGGTSVTLARADGGSALTYGGLIAYDATGKSVPAHLSVTTTADGQSLSIQVDDAGAQYPLTIDPFVQQAKLTGAEVDLSYFGYSVGMNGAGDVLIVGAKGQNFGANNGRGLAYIFARTGATWTQTAMLTASDAADGDELGTSVALSFDGATAVVGAPNAGGGQGAVYVFSPSGGSWAQTKKVTANDGAAGDHFGASVAIAAGGPFLVGAPDAKVGANVGQGASYVFTGGGASWAQAAKLVASDGAAGDGFGASVSISGDAGTAVIGAPHAIGQKGAAYVFTGAGASWAQATKLVASDGVAGDNFGLAVSTSYDGGVVLAGAPGVSTHPGAAYIYTKTGASWTPTMKLVASDATPNDSFGSSVAISASGLVAVVGSPLTPVGANVNQGAAYVYTKTGASWTPTTKLVSNDGVAYDLFGSSVALSADGGFVLSGAPRTGTAGHSITGAAYVYNNNNSAPVVVTNNPVDQTVTIGSTATFTAAATGGPSLSVQWQASRDGGATFINLEGKTQNWLTVPPSLADSNNLYRAYFSNAANSSAATTAARLTVVRQSTVLTITSSANPRQIGGTLDFTVTAKAANGVGTPNGGQVDIYFGSLHYSGVLVNGSVFFQGVPVQPLGTYTVGATYGGDGVFGQASATMPQVVGKGMSYLRGDVPTQAVAGQPVSLGAVLTYTGTTQPPYGGVMFMDNGQPINYVQLVTSGGSTWALYSTSTLSVGVHHIRLIYFGNPETLAASSDIYTLTITAPGASASAATSTPVTSTAAVSGATPVPGPGAPSNVGSSTSSARSLSAVGAAATSSITVTDNPVSQTVVLGSTASFTASAAGTGQLGVQWQVSGDGGANFVDVKNETRTWLVFPPTLAYSNLQYRAVFTDNLGNSATTTAATLTVVRQSAVLTITSDSNPRPIGGALNFTVNVASANGVGTPSGGQVDIYFGTLHYSALLVNGKAVFNSIPVQPLGTYSVGATYGGDTVFGQALATMPQVVGKGTSFLTGFVPTQAAAGQPVSITGVLTYSGTTQPPFGGVVVMDNGQPINYVQLATSGGVTAATYTTSSLSVGPHSIRLIYFGNVETLAASSDIYSLTITPAAAARATAVATTAEPKTVDPTAASFAAVGVVPTSKSTTAAIAAVPAPKAVAVQPKIAAVPRASAALVLQRRFTVAYKTS